MSLECSECEHDLRGGHDPSCSRYVKPCDRCLADECDEECDCECHTGGKPMTDTREKLRAALDRKGFDSNDIADILAVLADNEPRADVAQTNLSQEDYNALVRDAMLWRKQDAAQPLSSQGQPDGVLMIYYASGNCKLCGKAVSAYSGHYCLATGRAMSVKQDTCSHDLYWGDQLKPCGQPIVRDANSPTGFSHEYQLDPRGERVSWQHQAKP